MGETLMRCGLHSLFVLWIAWGSVSLGIPATRADEIDDLVYTRMAERQVPGLPLGVVEDGRLIKVKGYGLANVELKVPATEETIYQSGSVGKQFTATLIMMLVEEGTIDLTDPIVNFFENAPGTWKGITVQHLLSH